MSNCTRYLGLDVHAETITAAITEGRADASTNAPRTSAGADRLAGWCGRCPRRDLAGPLCRCG